MLQNRSICWRKEAPACTGAHFTQTPCKIPRACESLFCLRNICATGHLQSSRHVAFEREASPSSLLWQHGAANGTRGTSLSLRLSEVPRGPWAAAPCSSPGKWVHQLIDICVQIFFLCWSSSSPWIPKCSFFSPQSGLFFRVRPSLVFFFPFQKNQKTKFDMSWLSCEVLVLGSALSPLIILVRPSWKVPNKFFMRSKLKYPEPLGAHPSFDIYIHVHVYVYMYKYTHTCRT